MSHIWTLAKKDLLQTSRDRLAFLFIIVMPLVFTLFFGLLFGGLHDEETGLPVAIVDHDGGPAAEELVNLLKESEAVELGALPSEEEANQAVDQYKVAGAIIIPAGFSAAFNTEEQPEIAVIAVQGSSGSQSVIEAVRSALTRLTSARLAVDAALEANELDPENSEARSAAAAVVESALKNPAVTVKAEAAGTTAGEIPSGFDQASPGMVINFVLFSLMTAAISLTTERKTGALRRLLTTRVRRTQIMGGKILGMAILSFLQQVALVGVGQFLFGVDYLRDPAALLLVMISLSMLAASLGLLIGTLFHSEQAVIATTVILSMVLAALGGAWFPLEITGSTFSTIGHLTPTAWVLDGFRGIILRGWGVADVLPSVGAAWGYALVFFGLSAWRFRFE